MRTLKWAFSALLISIQLLLSTATPNCPIMGHELPHARHLSTHPVFQAALQNLTDSFNALDSSAQDYSYSVQVFSAYEDPLILFEHHHTAPNLASLKSPGVTKVDGNTVYRLGSVTKVFTVLAFLAEVGDVHFNEPITNFVPELAQFANAGDRGDAVRNVDWQDVTLGSLASQISGIQRDYGVLGEVTQSITVSQAETVGFPPLSPQEIPPCGAYPLCNRQQFFNGLTNLYPAYAPWQTPTYSNIAYQLLAYALESITGKSFSSILYDRIIGPLNLAHTYYWSAQDSIGIIPGTASSTLWNAYLGDASPAGNMYSSATDISTLGRAILNSTLLRPALTRRWLNPVSFTSDMVESIGAPWGVRRIRLDGPNSNRLVTAFSKAGGIGNYTALLTVLRDVDIGFTVLIAGQPPGNLHFYIADALGGALLPAIDAAEREDATMLYAGHYVSNDTSKLNSSLTITTDPDKPGLGVGPWISNGTDMVAEGTLLSEYWSGITPVVRMYYTGLETVAADGSKQQSFKAVFEDVGIQAQEGMFSTYCGTWIDVTGVTYGALPLDEFVFQLDSRGNVVSVDNLALRVRLYKRN